MLVPEIKLVRLGSKCLYLLSYLLACEVDFLFYLFISCSNKVEEKQ